MGNIRVDAYYVIRIAPRWCADYGVTEQDRFIAKSERTIDGRIFWHIPAIGRLNERKVRHYWPERAKVDRSDETLKRLWNAAMPFDENYRNKFGYNNVIHKFGNEMQMYGHKKGIHFSIIWDKIQPLLIRIQGISVRKSIDFLRLALELEQINYESKCKTQKSE